MIWSLYATLGRNMWYTEYPNIDTEDEAWNIIVDAAELTGINQIVLDLGEGVQYGSHPELAKSGAWTRQRVRAEVKRCKEKGIELIPKLNFSATHHLWLGEYRRMMSTPTYYRVCRELITEVYDLFDKPRFIHLGMDEEGDPQFFDRLEMVAYRRGELIWHDLQYLCDCVRDCGTTPWIWADLCLEYPEEFRKRVGKDVMLSPWNYNALRPEHYTPIASKQRHIDYYGKEPYKSMNLTYVEEEPFCTRFMAQAAPAARDGYKIVPCVSTWAECEYNTDDNAWYFKENAPAENLAGFMTAPWKHTTMENVDEIIRSMELLKEAREKYFG